MVSKAFCKSTHNVVRNLVSREGKFISSMRVYFSYNQSLFTFWWMGCNITHHPTLLLKEQGNRAYEVFLLRLRISFAWNISRCSGKSLPGKRGIELDLLRRGSQLRTFRAAGQLTWAKSWRESTIRCVSLSLPRDICPSHRWAHAGPALLLEAACLCTTFVKVEPMWSRLLWSFASKLNFVQGACDWHTSVTRLLPATGVAGAASSWALHWGGTDT